MAGQIAGVAVSLPGQMTVAPRVMVHAKAPFPEVPAIVGGLAIRLPKIVVELVGAVDAIISVLVDFAAVARAAQSQMLVTASPVNEPALSIAGALAQDTDHAVHRVGAPDRRPRTPDHFDPIHVVKKHLLGIPIDPGEQGRIDGTAIDHH